jgi:regulatory protein
MVKKETIENIKKFCSSKETCKSEISTKLVSWKIDKEDIDQIIKELEKEKFIDEIRYAKSFTNDKIKFGKWGKLKIVHEMRLKKIPDNIILETINSFEMAEYIKIIDHELEKKIQTIIEPDKNVFRDKVLRFAFSRGYERQIVDAYLKKKFRH